MERGVKDYQKVQVRGNENMKWKRKRKGESKWNYFRGRTFQIYFRHRGKRAQPKDITKDE